MTDQPMLPFHTGEMPEARAVLQQERIKKIMADTGCTFSQACDQYIREKHGEPELPAVSRASHHS